jgi:ABC-2 type transport system ATP-binding protein
MDPQAILTLDRVTKKIGAKTIIDNLSFEVRRGEVFGLLGPNGAGKTTAIRMMVGLMSITEGRILIDGLDVRTEFEAAMTRVGAIIENPEFYKFLSGYRNLLHFARMIPGITEERIREIVQLVGLQHRIDDKVKTYSLGMRQRLGVAQAILHRPKLLILDEPTNGLDPAGIRELRDYLRRLAELEGIAVLVSSHLLSEMCDRVAIIQNGKLMDVRTLRETPESAPSAVRPVAFEVDRVAEAAERLRALAGSAASVQAEAGRVVAMLTHEQIPEMVAGLAAAGFRLYGVSKLEKSLEDQFLEATRGGQIV